MKHNYVTEALNAMQYMAVALQDNPILQGVQLGLSILTSIVLVTYRIWKWWNEAKNSPFLGRKTPSQPNTLPTMSSVSPARPWSRPYSPNCISKQKKPLHIEVAFWDYYVL